MIKRFQNLFRDQKQQRLFLLLCLATLFNFVLVGYRLHYMAFDFSKIQSFRDLLDHRGYATFLFLIWNLFLAWVPYFIALIMDRTYEKTKSKGLLGFLFVAWLLFFPNAPYILTDLLHLKSRHPIPHWYDLMMIVSFAWTGLMLGYLSLFEVQRFLTKKFSARLGMGIAVGSILLCSFGIYLGRFLRWNTWDVLFRPHLLIGDIFEVVFNPFAYTGTLGIAVILACFLLIGYFILNTLISDS